MERTDVKYALRYRYRYAVMSRGEARRKRALPLGTRLALEHIK